MQTSAATAGASGQLRTNSGQTPLLRNRAGLRCYAVFGISDAAAVANARMFVGLNTTTASMSNAEPSSQTNCIGLGADAGETTFSIMHNDGSGAATKIALGANFPADTRNADIYALTLTAQPGAATVEYLVERYNSDPVTPGFHGIRIDRDQSALGDDRPAVPFLAQQRRDGARRRLRLFRLH